jgi:hypothetical protein
LGRAKIELSVFWGYSLLLVREKSYVQPFCPSLTFTVLSDIIMIKLLLS